MRFVVGAMCCGFCLSLFSACEQTEQPETKIEGIPATGQANIANPRTPQERFRAMEKPAGENPYGGDYPGGKTSPAR
jgi:hypothetical protein